MPTILKPGKIFIRSSRITLKKHSRVLIFDHLIENSKRDPSGIVRNTRVSTQGLTSKYGLMISKYQDGQKPKKRQHKAWCTVLNTPANKRIFNLKKIIDTFEIRSLFSLTNLFDLFFYNQLENSFSVISEWVKHML